MLRNVVVPLDGSEFSTTAIPTAVAVAHAAGAGISLVGVAPSESRLAWTYSYVEAALGLLPLTIAAREAEVFVNADPTGVLLERASDPAEVLCFASHDRPGPAGTLRHSVGSQLIADATHPFLVVGTGADKSSPTGDVVVGLDGGDGTELLLATALRWAQTLHAPLRLVTVFEPIAADLRDPSHYSRSVGPPVDPALYLETLRDHLGETTGVDVDVAPIPDPVGVVSGLRHHLGEQPGLLLVVGRGSHAASGLQPSVVRGLLRMVPTAVLVLPTGPQPDREPGKPAAAHAS